MSYFKKSLALCTLTLLPVIVVAQTCQTASITATTPTNRFTINKNGTVNDTKTGLMWKMCSEGQSGTDCSSGSAAYYTWQLALQQAQTINNGGGFAGYSDWRVPNVKELVSITENQCTDPAINLTVFPNTPSDWFWSSSHNFYNSIYAWYVDFNGGYPSYDGKDSGSFVRLVRDLNSSSGGTVETPKSVTPTTKGDVETFVSFHKFFSYTKIANDGSELLKTAKLGTAPTDWACTKDNKTGLIWEVKTDDGGLRDKDWGYSWYNKTNGGFEGNPDESYLKCSFSDNCNSYTFTDEVNKQGLCGKKDWRLPTNEELRELVVCSDVEILRKPDYYGRMCRYTTTSPTINTTYFPNTRSNWFLSSSANDYGYGVWFKDFDYINGGLADGSVRLVRG